jgi:hypothetical protein
MARLKCNIGFQATCPGLIPTMPNLSALGTFNERELYEEFGPANLRV